MYYLIDETLRQIAENDIQKNTSQYIAIVSAKEWYTQKESFDMGIDIDIDIEFGMEEVNSTKAEVNFDSLTGTFLIPNRDNLWEEGKKFSFALDEKGVVFIDDSGEVEKIVNEIKNTKKWRFPSLERFLYDFLEQIIKDDRRLLEQYDKELDDMETDILNNNDEELSERVNDIRSEIRDLRVHYEQLIDLGQELEENENHFFRHENLRYFRLFTNRVERLRDSAVAISDHAIQIRDIYTSHLDIKQNRIMTVLTVVTTIFMPLTLIAGWYGMNFRYMPELEWRFSYPAVIAISILIVILCLFWFKKKKWM